MNLRPKSEPHSNLQNGLSNPLSLRKDITSLPLSCPFPSALPRWGQVAEPGLALKKKQGPRILYSSFGVWLLREVPAVCWRCSGRVSPGAISQGGCARHRPDRQNTPAIPPPLPPAPLQSASCSLLGTLFHIINKGPWQSPKASLCWEQFIIIPLINIPVITWSNTD